ncbi:MAG TPA: hypothetical protein VL147_16065 [Devosia sp.]|nr:hypothetical protein [Devosia sp.]
MKFVLAAFLAVLTTIPTAADGRSDWTGYDWRKAAFGQCLSTEAGCHVFRSKWDWKRNQWVDITYSLQADGDLTLVQKLTNNDPKDSDFVCVTVLFLDAQGRNVTASHTNIEIGPRSVKTFQNALPLTTDLASAIRSVEFGSKQCRQGAGQDDLVFEAVAARLPGK